MTQTQTFRVEFELSYEGKAPAALALRLMAAEKHLEALTEAAIVLEQAPTVLNHQVPRKYHRWLAEVGEPVWAALGCGIEDITDCLWRDWYDEGLFAAEAAERVITKEMNNG